MRRTFQITLLTLSILCSAAFGQGMDVAVLGADDTFAQDDVQAYLLATGRFNSVTIVDARLVTPNAAELASYDAVLTWSNFDYFDSVALGDNLADYVDQGGGVVVMVFCNTSSGFNRTLQGRWASGAYFIMEPTSGTQTNSASLGTRLQPNHPILDQVNSFFGGSTAFRGTSTSFSSQAERVADWTDGKPLILVDESHEAPRADLNFYPESSNSTSSYWDVNTDGATLIANALEWTAGGGLPELAFIQVLPGQYLTFDIRRLDSESNVVTLLSSNGPGPTVTPFGEILVTLPWFQTPPFAADVNGVVNFTTTLPAGASGHTLYSQAVELLDDGTFKLSNALEFPVP